MQLEVKICVIDIQRTGKELNHSFFTVKNTRYNGKPGLDSWNEPMSSTLKWTQTSNFTIFIYFNDSIRDSSFSLCVLVNRLKY